MTFWPKSLKSVGVFSILFILLICIGGQQSLAQIPDVVIDVSDTTAYPGTTNTVISIYMDNLTDTIAGFNIWLQMDRPDIAIFQTNFDTNYDATYFECLQYSGGDCIDSVIVPSSGDWDFMYVETTIVAIGNFDTSGTLCSGWDLVDSRSISGQGTDINIAAIADLPGGGSLPGILPGVQGGLLIKVLADIFDIPDEWEDRTVNLLVQTDFKDHFGLSRPNGTSIPWIYEEVEDTSCFVCTQWIGEICVNYVEVTFGDCDSTFIETVSVAVLDTANIKVFDGSVTVLVPQPYVCGNVDSSDPPEIDIADLVFMVNYMFGGGVAPEPIVSGDLDCNTDVDIADLVYMVNFMFGGGAEPCAGC